MHSAKPARVFAGDALAQDQPAEHDHPDRRGGGEERRVGDAGGDDREMPEEQIAGEGEARQDRRDAEAPGRRGARFAQPHPGVKGGQRQGDAPERAGERPDVGQSHEDRRNAHRQGADDERGERRPEAAGAGCAAGKVCVIRFGRLQRAKRGPTPAVNAGPSLFSPHRSSKGAAMDAMLMREIAKAQDAFQPVERIEGALDGGVLVVCDHAANAFPPGYGALGLPREALERHIAYDIGAAQLARRLAARLGAPAVLSTFSRLLIDPNRGARRPDPGDAHFRRRARAGQRAHRARARSSAAAVSTGRRTAPRSKRPSKRCWRRESRRRSFPSIPSRRIGAASRGPGRSASCGTPIRACREPLMRALAREEDLGEAGNRRQRAL